MVRISLFLGFAAGAIILLGGCTYDLAGSHAPEYPPGYDSGMGSGLVAQPGDRFGAQNVASTAVFEAPLAPYGRWVNSRYGTAFRPDAPDGWRPYVNGRWGENRLWISNDPWGWATDHYGRWGHDEQLGWVWVPGTEWAPSWVAFRDDPGQNIAGWAPVPPGVNYSLAAGFGNGWGFDNFNNWYGPAWIWVPRSFLYQPNFGGRVLPWSYGASYWGGSRWQYQPGWGNRPNWQVPHWGNNGDRPGNRSDWRHDANRRDERQLRGPRPGQAPVADRDGFTGYRYAPRPNTEQPLTPVANRPPAMPRANRPDRPVREPNAAPQQYVERAAPPERSEMRGRTAAGDPNSRPD